MSKSCTEKKQVIILVEDFKLEKSVSLFVGKVGNKMFMMRLKDEYVGMPVAKVAEKFFAPNCMDKSVSSEGCIIISPNVFFVDEPSLMIKSTCDTAMGMFIPNGIHSEIEPGLHQLNMGYREFHQIWVKGFTFMNGFTPFPPELNGQPRDTYGESFGFCYKNGMFKISKGEHSWEKYEFEECVEFSMGHLRASRFQRGNFLDFVYVRGKVKKESKTICTLSGWKRLCTLSSNPNWISQVTVR